MSHQPAHSFTDIHDENVRLIVERNTDGSLWVSAANHNNDHVVGMDLTAAEAVHLGAFLIAEFAVSKGVARRKLEEALGLDPVRDAGQLAGVGVAGQIGRPPIGAEWYDKLQRGMAATRPPLPHIAEPLTNFINNITVVKRPWWKFWGK